MGSTSAASPSLRTKSEVGHIAYGIPNFMKYKDAIKKEMEKYHLTEIRPDGEVGWICNDPAGYMLNIIVEKDKAMYPGAAAFCDVADSDKMQARLRRGSKISTSARKPDGPIQTALLQPRGAATFPNPNLQRNMNFTGT